MTDSSTKGASGKKGNVPKNYYFIEHEVAPLILDWQKYYEQQTEIKNFLQENEENLSPSDKQKLEQEYQKSVENAAPKLEKIMNETYKVIKGVIFKAEFQKKEKYNNCFQIAVEACIKALPRFDPQYGTAFNYLSLTAKKSIIFHLIKRAKKKHLSLDYEYMDDDNLQLKNFVKQEEKTLRNLEIENLTDTIDNIIEESGEHKSLHNVNKELREYLFYHQGKYDKKDFFKWAKSDGVSSNLLRKYIKFLKDNRERLYGEVGVYD